MSQHTPGPWKVQDDGLGVYYVNPRIEAGEDFVDACHDSIIARCTDFGPLSGIEDEEAEANARLIAKAPEMLSLLRRLIGNPHEGMSVSRVVKDARALLRAIEGQ